MSRMRRRAAGLIHSQKTTRQDHLPAIGQQLAATANRAGVAARFPDPAVHKRIAVALARIGPYAPLLRDMAWAILNTAKPHAAHTRYRLRTGPGIGEILSLGLLSAIHDIQRFPRGQDVLSSWRLGKCATASAGKRFGPAGAKLGHASLTWAFSEAAVLLLRDPPVAQPSLARWAKQPGTGKAFTGLAHKVARAVYDLLTRTGAVATPKFFHGARRGAGAPGASLDHQRSSLRPALGPRCLTAAWNADARLGLSP